MKHIKGFSLIEVIIFIVVMAILGSTILLSFNLSLNKTPIVYTTDVANQLATQCLEALIGMRRLGGYTGIFTTCSTPSAASLPSLCTSNITGYTISVSYVCSPTLTGDSASSKTLVVGVTGKGNATLQMLVTSY